MKIYTRFLFLYLLLCFKTLLFKIVDIEEAMEGCCRLGRKCRFSLLTFLATRSRLTMRFEGSAFHLFCIGKYR